MQHDQYLLRLLLLPCACTCYARLGVGIPPASSIMQRALLLLSTLCTASVAFRFAPPRTPSLSAKPNIGLASSSSQTHVGLRKRVAAGGWQAPARSARRTIFGSSDGDIQEEEASLDWSESFAIGIPYLASHMWFQQAGVCLSVHCMITAHQSSIYDTRTYWTGLMLEVQKSMYPSGLRCQPAHVRCMPRSNRCLPVFTAVPTLPSYDPLLTRSPATAS